MPSLGALLTMVKAENFEALKWAYRQTKDGTVISFLMQPHDINAQLATAPLGTRYMVAFAQIGDDEKPVELSKEANNATAEKAKPRTPWHELKPSQQAGIRCADRQFQYWCGTREEYQAAAFVRHECGVKSRAELDTNKSAATRWYHIESSFVEETGRSTEQRG